MALFDYYEPSGDRYCPACSTRLLSWQGKDGPNGLFVWVEGRATPAGQRVDDDVRLDA
jgi:hypothetical protein